MENRCPLLDLDSELYFLYLTDFDFEIGEFMGYMGGERIGINNHVYPHHFIYNEGYRNNREDLFYEPLSWRLDYYIFTG